MLSCRLPSSHDPGSSRLVLIWPTLGFVSSKVKNSLQARWPATLQTPLAYIVRKACFASGRGTTVFEVQHYHINVNDVETIPVSIS